MTHAMNWAAADIRRVQADSPRDVWDRLLDTLVAYWAESLPDQLNDPEWRAMHEERMRRRLAEHSTWLWLFEREAKTHALANFFITLGRAHIAEFFVVPAHRREGLGTFLIGEMRRVLREEGITRVAINLPHGAAAQIDFWRVAGFSEVSVQLEMSTRELAAPPARATRAD